MKTGFFKVPPLEKPLQSARPYTHRFFTDARLILENWGSLAKAWKICLKSAILSTMEWLKRMGGALQEFKQPFP